MSEFSDLASWRHVERSSPDLLGSLHDARSGELRPLATGQLSKNHSRPNALASTMFLLFGTRCRSGARGHVFFEARRPRARPLKVRRAVGLDRSFVRKLWHPLSTGATRPAANIMICHLASSLSRGCPSTGTIHPPRTCIEPTLQKDTSPTRHS